MFSAHLGERYAPLASILLWILKNFQATANFLSYVCNTIFAKQTPCTHTVGFVGHHKPNHYLADQQSPTFADQWSHAAVCSRQPTAAAASPGA